MFEGKVKEDFNGDSGEKLSENLRADERTELTPAKFRNENDMCDISIMYYNLASSLYRFISIYVDKICIHRK